MYGVFGINSIWYLVPSGAMSSDSMILHTCSEPGFGSMNLVQKLRFAANSRFSIASICSKASRLYILFSF